jgi:hypothetical protein
MSLIPQKFTFIEETIPEDARHFLANEMKEKHVSTIELTESERVAKDAENIRRMDWIYKMTNPDNSIKFIIIVELYKIPQIKHISISPHSRLFIEIKGSKIQAEPIKENIYSVFKQLNIALHPNDLLFQYFIRC